MKKIVATILSTVVFSSVIPVTAAVTSPDIRVEVDKTNIKFPDAKPYLDKSNNRTMIPVRFVSEALGSKVDWDQKNQKVILNKDGKEIVLKIGEKKAVVDGQEITFDAHAVVKENRTYVPLRFVSESFEARVTWSNSEKLVRIYTKNWTGTIEATTGGNGSESKVGAVGQFTVIPPKDSSMLLPKDAVTEQAIEEFLGSLKYEKGIVSGKIPHIPDGHTINFHYVDTSDGKWGNRANDKEFNNLKEGDTFSVKTVDNGGYLSFGFYKGAEGKNGVSVTLPELSVEWSSKR